jgi:putative transposase
LARPWRIEYEGAYYHVLSRGNERRDIFFGDGDRKLFLATLGEASDRFEVDVFAFVLMDNHYHLLLRTNLPNLSRAMQWLGLTYARRLNDRLGRSGHLFQGRFKAMLVENDAYVVELSCYIHRNPLRAKMVKRLIEYRWSSYPVYAYGRKGPQWLKTDPILSFFGGRDPHKWYRDKVRDYAGEERGLWEDFRHGLILGGEGFVEKIRSMSARSALHTEVPQQKRVLASVDPKKVAAEALLSLGRGLEGYGSGHRVRGEVKEDRDLLIYALWEKGLFRNEEIGRLFGVSYSAVSHIASDVRELTQKDPQVRNKVSRINSQFKI